MFPDWSKFTFVTAMTKYPEQTLQRRKGLFWLTVSEVSQPSWWGRHGEVHDDRSVAGSPHFVEGQARR